MSLWGATVITNLMSAIPWVGQDIVEFIWGGFSVNNATLNRFFSLHFVLPFILAALALMHLIALHDSAGSGNPLGTSGNYDRIAFAPYYIFKDLITIFIFILILSLFVFFMPNLLGDSENYVMANPMQTPPAIVPEWYLLPFYAILRSIPNKLLGVIAMFSAILILLALPFTDLSRSRGIQFRPLSKIAFFIFAGNFLVLMQLGAKHVESPFIEFGQISTVIYFAYFLIFMPLITLFENSIQEFTGISEDEIEIYDQDVIMANFLEILMNTVNKTATLYNTTPPFSRYNFRGKGNPYDVQNPAGNPNAAATAAEKAAGPNRWSDTAHSDTCLIAQTDKKSKLVIWEKCHCLGGQLVPKDNCNCGRGHDWKQDSQGNLDRKVKPTIVDPKEMKLLEEKKTDGFLRAVKTSIFSIIKLLSIIVSVVLFFTFLLVLLDLFDLTNLNHVVYLDAPRPWGIYFQDSATPQMEGLVELHDNILFYLVIILFSVGWVLWSIVRSFLNNKLPISYKYVGHGTLIELIWTISPAIILILIAFPSFKLLYLMDEVTDPSLAILAEGHQWYWSYQYPDFLNSENEFIEFDSYLVPESDLENGALRMLEVDNRAVLPELTHVRFVVTGGDVIHSYACPALGIKCDAYPGRLNQASVLMNREGTFYGLRPK